jgi:ADP-ribosylglycohydrolase
MRVAPLGVWFADDLARVEAEATSQGRVTHAHPEAVAGSVAVAIGAALAVRGIAGSELLAETAARVPDTEVGSRLRQATTFRPDANPMHVAGTIGCGVEIAAHDTVPFALWCAAHHLDDLTEALWITAAPGGDSDTTCAIVGGVVGGVSGLDGVPGDWIEAGEAVPYPSNRS